ncbi:hypothetical protein AAF712_014939 [Marasmius tenuissimus]|uniref:Uncharacterized protein n=1 Tax=Marasmius tenuissimus TaxID=585030 RepID=A0ABR2ZC86_9AGAR
MSAALLNCETVMKSLIERLRASLLGVARQAIDDIWYHLEQFYEAVKDKFGDTLKPFQQFLRSQLELLLKGIQHVLQEYRKFKAEHPYIVAIAEIVAGIGLSAGFIVAMIYLSPAILGALGFGPLGPIAGTFAATFQSTFYGGYACGLFSILQSVSMTGILGWPAVAILTGLAAVAIGRIGRLASKRACSKQFVAYQRNIDPGDEVELKFEYDDSRDSGPVKIDSIVSYCEAL